ncbi:biotin-independent malonate decarboxylase subunit beta [Chryseobacterium rhizosphaerae]|uniref:Biotin-independent malonate decarboxylase subunit beta n=1 Tax=Chryseobacterium rhizosphaerae TaxID=395937 RepID=A0ABX9IG02_9FLAO|nr:biotin-independent malonate decarboxylase subunit beta [Chryseobacterium rhizosphaerae]REC72632.1 biotin-independent malonate decarboxylase subunit beta [Chryseobacterium rhizosphaerae]GEN69233.1 biotin-independent malonate decarboxylase subunit beta [Chryseobacterium rhizosphaerae]
MKTSFIELKGRERAQALLDINTFEEILDPFERIESPHLPAQGIVPESDDGVVIARGTISGQPAVILSIEGSFQGGGIGEVSGSKIAGSLEYVLKDIQNGKKIIPVIIFDTGGVRLQEANYGLLCISEIQSAIVALKRHVPVIGLIPGNVGCFGGMSITAALCSTLIITETARFGLNGPEVIEQEAGIEELNSRDRRLIWDTIGGRSRFETGLVDQLVEDDIPAFKKAIIKAVTEPDTISRTRQIEHYLSLISQIDLSVKNTKTDFIELNKKKKTEVKAVLENKPVEGKGRTWFTILTEGASSISEYPSLLVADTQFEGKLTRFIAVVPNEANRFPRARHGEVGLLEGWAIAKYVRQAIDEDAHKADKRNIVAIIDVPSQAYGYHEELFGIHYACAAGVDAYASARISGHSVTGFIVGNAISGAFLTHGMQASRLVALNDPSINIQAMSKESAARITKRTIAELEKATQKVPAMAYDVASFNALGPLDALVTITDTTHPDSVDIQKVSAALGKAIHKADDTLNQRLETPNAINQGRAYSRLVRTKIGEQWN